MEVQLSISMTFRSCQSIKRCDEEVIFSLLESIKTISSTNKPP